MLSTCVHEAAHARIALLFGLEVEAWIEADPRSVGRLAATRYAIPEHARGGSRKEPSDESPEEHRRAMDRAWMAVAAMRFAGRAAERRLGAVGEAEVLDGSNTDHDSAGDAIAEMSDSSRRYSANMARAEALARQLVREHWDDIIAIALELMTRRRLSDADLRAIVARVQRPNQGGDDVT